MSSFTDPLVYTPLNKKFKGRDLFQISKTFRYRLGSYENPIGIVTVPQGFVTDLASIPWPINIVFKPDGDYVKAAIVHDYLIEETKKGGFQTFAVADSIFREAMLVCGVNKFVTYLFYLSVRMYAYVR